MMRAKIRESTVREADVCQPLPDDLLLLVRTRSHEIFELLLDIGKIRAERRKAKANNSKYISAKNRGWSCSRWGSSGWGSSVIGDTGWGSSGSGGGGWGSFGSGGGGWDSTSSGNGGWCSSADVTVGWGSASNSNGGWGSTSGGTCYEGLTSDNIGSWGGGSYGGYHGGYSESNYSGGSNFRSSTPQQEGKLALSQTVTTSAEAPENPPVRGVNRLDLVNDDAPGSGSVLSPISAPGIAPPQPTRPTPSPDGTLPLATPLELRLIPVVDCDSDDLQTTTPPAPNLGIDILHLMPVDPHPTATTSVSESSTPLAPPSPI